MLILAFDTSNNIVSCAILENEKLIDKISVFENARQAELLLPLIEEILHKNQIWYNDLDLIATCSGPGSFTGVRIGLVVARTIKISTNIPLILVNSCETIAYKYRDNLGKIFVINDAKMNEFFGGEFLAQNNEIKTIREPFLISESELFDILPKENFLLCGTAKNRLEIDSPNDDVIESDLIGLLAYKKFINNDFTTDLNPLYLRLPKIEARKK